MAFQPIFPRKRFTAQNTCEQPVSHMNVIMHFELLVSTFWALSIIL